MTGVIRWQETSVRVSRQIVDFGINRLHGPGNDTSVGIQSYLDVDGVRIGSNIGDSIKVPEPGGDRNDGIVECDSCDGECRPVKIRI